MDNSNIYNSFEIPPEKEWNKYLGIDIFNRLRIDINVLKISDDFLTGIIFDDLRCWIQQHNNKVGSLNITYVFAKYYFDKGIPDDEWIKSPGSKGQSWEYMPHFEPKHWLIRYWFSYFVEILYYKIFSIWDSVIGLLNIFYQMNFAENLRLRNKVLNYLKNNKRNLYDLLLSISREPLYIEANNYRMNIVHGLSPNDIAIRNKKEYVDEAEMYETDENGNLIKKKVKGVFQVSMGVGKYFTTKQLMKNIEEFTVYSGQKIEEILSLIKDDEFVLKNPFICSKKL